MQRRAMQGHMHLKHPEHAVSGRRRQLACPNCTATQKNWEVDQCPYCDHKFISNADQERLLADAIASSFTSSSATALAKGGPKPAPVPAVPIPRMSDFHVGSSATPEQRMRRGPTTLSGDALLGELLGDSDFDADSQSDLDDEFDKEFLAPSPSRGSK